MNLISDNAKMLKSNFRFLYIFLKFTYLDQAITKFEQVWIEIVLSQILPMHQSNQQCS